MHCRAATLNWQTSVPNCSFLSVRQNYLSESMKTLDKNFPGQGAGSLTDSKPKDLAGGDLKK